MLGAKLRCAAGQVGGGAADDYLAYYTGDNVSGGVVYDETGKHNGAIAGTVTTGAGYAGDALIFSGAGRVTATIPVGSGDATFALIIEPSSTATQALVNQYGTPTTSHFRGLLLSANGLSAVTRNSSGDYCNTTPFNIHDGDPHIAHFIQDGSVARLYVDGVAVGSVDAGTVGTYTNQFIFGARQNNATVDLYYNGYEDEIRIYDYAFSAADVAADASNYGF